jgi:hypothetical protein
MPIKDLINVLNTKILLNVIKLSAYYGKHNGNEKDLLTCIGDPFQISTDPSVCLIKNLQCENPVNIGLEDVINSKDYNGDNGIMKLIVPETSEMIIKEDISIPVFVTTLPLLPQQGS